MHNAVMCTLNMYDVIRIMRHLHIKLKSFSKIAKPLHKEAVCGCSILYIIAEKLGIMSEAFLVDVSIVSHSDFRATLERTSNSSQSTRPTGRVLWGELLVLPRFHC